MLIGIAGVVLAYLTTLFILPLILNMLVKANFVRPNFRQENIPLGVGLVFFLSGLITIGILNIVLVLLSFWDKSFIDTYGLINHKTTYIFLFAWASMTLLGALDDVFGSREASGLKGHFNKLFKEGELTTGGLKALAGGFIALLISLALSTEVVGLKSLHIIVDSLIIGLSTNLINLLDLRPGRAGKSFLVISLLLYIVSLLYTKDFIFSLKFFNGEMLFSLIIIGSLLAYLPIDLKARGMMGDTGSNVLGITIGVTSVLMLPMEGRVIYLAILIGLHIFTEKYSLTAVIEKNRLLKYLDQLGRG